MTQDDLRAVFTKNRAEEFGHDVWPHFVVPLFFDELDLRQAAKPRILMGGRGCGKTMLLRYLSHASTFSTQRQEPVTEADISQIGLYWRADTQFCSALTGRGIEEDVWRCAFDNYIALAIGAEIARSLFSVAQHSNDFVSQKDVDRLDFADLAAFDDVLKGSLTTVEETLKKKDWAFQSWINNPRQRPQPIFLPGRAFLDATISIIKKQLPALAQTRFAVYIDEYENLLDAQQVSINTHLKHSEGSLIFNIATKRHGMRVRQTNGNEQIMEVADFRTYDLDELLRQNDFELFAAEILMLRMSQGRFKGVPIDIATLRNPQKLKVRRSAEYRKEVLSLGEKIFPGLSQKELAIKALSDSAIRTKLTRDITTALNQRNVALEADRFLDDAYPEESVICPALLRRTTLDPNEVLLEFDALRKNQTSRFKDWTHNNFIGCLLQLYAPHSRTCPFYAGFDAFILLARGNLRHFLELCHKSLKKIDPTPLVGDLSISPDTQAEAAREASSIFLGEVRSFGNLGNRLHAFVLSLGNLFAIAHQHPAQSEPEINHFSISGGEAGLDEEDANFLREAAKWSVLFEAKETKVKNPLEPSATDWILNPIYAPYFHISFRKKRKLMIASDDFRVLVRGNYDQRSALFSAYRKKWKVESSAGQLSLFSTPDDK